MSSWYMQDLLTARCNNEDGWAVYLGTEIAGQGETREEAIADAIKTLEDLVKIFRQRLRVRK